MKKIEHRSENEIDASWLEVEQLLLDFSLNRKSKKRSRIYYMWGSVAAILLISLITSLIFYSRPTVSPMLAALNEIGIMADSVKEISLVTSGNYIELQDESTLKYNPDGLTSINKKQVKLDQKNASADMENVYNHLAVPKGRRMNITFEDGTKMYVNAGSHVIYPTKFEKRKREIAVEGEVFLEVARDTERPFIVKTGNFNVKVLGTVFNVSAYKNEKSASVVLVEGSVEVETGLKEKVLLSPDQMACITEAGMSKEQVNVFKYICWKDNLMFFKNDKTGAVLDRIARYYGVNIGYDEEVSNILITGKLDLQGGLNSALDIIKESVSIQSREDGHGGYHLYVVKK